MLPMLQFVLFLSSSVLLIAGERSNVALNKKAWMSTIWQHSAAIKAVDGEKGAYTYKSSAHTKEDESIAWWKVDLEREVQSPLVKLYFRREYKFRRNGVQLYTSSTNSSGPEGGMLCYTVRGHRDGTDIPDILNTTCSGTWRFLTVYTNTNNDMHGAVLDFVEVEVWSEMTKIIHTNQTMKES